MEFRILGPIRVTDGDHEEALRGAKQRTVLATLLLAGGRVVSDEQLTERLWDWHRPATASAQIYTYVSRLRKLLRGELVINRLTTGYQMNIDDLDCDHVRFEELSQAGAEALRDGRYTEAAAVLRRALGLWRGRALEDATARLIEMEGPRLQEARMTALEARIEADLALGRHRQLTAELTGLVASNPLRERLRAQLMTALYRCDRQAEAVAAYHEGRTLLVEELGVDPGRELTETYQQLLTGALALPRAGAWSGVTPAMLPRDLGDFTGREPERASIAAWLRAKSPEPIVITGMPGIGKTMLAVHAAHADATSFPDGHLFAELHSPADQPRRLEEVLGGFLVALGTPPQMLPTGLDWRIQLYRSLLATKRMLIVLDDAETLEQVQPFLPTSGPSAAIITTQTPAAAPPGSRVLNLDPLTPQQARELLGAIVGERRLQAEQQATGEVLRYCGGMPMALRIAGARLVANPGWRVADLADRLHPVDRRMDELHAGDLDLRQRLQRGYSRLDVAHQAVMRRLGQSGTTVRDEYIAVDVAQILDELTERGLLNAAGPRYRMHELMYLWANGLGDPVGELSS
ncbi:AfsR/SARP family transcriptional regulator [Actinoallomurus rhizosphaericola]|uniref:AfsR/SARP family transcriptional regulator n=1 Tax=Actinoallomurus rhizosphaericola TaxID=2952536 RepID=UPI0020931649|nr:BTAD domain-containing putative transcriptional regulator [Actinoallomurus rhizosphaericola]MCO5995867.1 NB-ARC domain-containing protein [Actinoallomurus rhizosphaericola]